MIPHFPHSDRHCPIGQTLQRADQPAGTTQTPMASQPSRLLRYALLAGTLSVAIASSPAMAYPFYAPPKAKPDAPTLSGDAELGYTRLSGNTNSQTLIAKTRLAWLDGDWLHTLRLEARTVSEDEETEDEHYLASWRERYDLSGPHYLFGFTRWERERDSGYDRQLTAIGGYGRQLLDNPTHELSLEAGPGYRDDRLEDQDSQQLAVAYGAMDYRFTLSDTGYFEQQVSVETTSENTTLRSLSSITSKLTSRLALRLSHEIKHNSQPPDSAETRTDTTTSASLQLSW